jgi:predicted MFS family arabinose efflux permease
VVVGAAVASVGGLLFLVGVSWAVVAVTAPLLVARLAPADRRGAALATYTAVMSAGTGVGSVSGGAVAAAVGYRVTFTLAGASVVLGALVAWWGLARVGTGGLGAEAGSRYE